MHSWLRKGGAQRQRSVSAVVGVEGRQDAPPSRQWKNCWGWGQGGKLSPLIGFRGVRGWRSGGGWLAERSMGELQARGGSRGQRQQQACVVH